MQLIRIGDRVINLDHVTHAEWRGDALTLWFTSIAQLRGAGGTDPDFYEYQSLTIGGTEGRNLWHWLQSNATHIAANRIERDGVG